MSLGGEGHFLCYLKEHFNNINQLLLLGKEKIVRSEKQNVRTNWNPAGRLFKQKSKCFNRLLVFILCLVVLKWFLTTFFFVLGLVRTVICSSLEEYSS